MRCDVETGGSGNGSNKPATRRLQRPKRVRDSIGITLCDGQRYIESVHELRGIECVINMSMRRKHPHNSELAGLHVVSNNTKYSPRRVDDDARTSVRLHDIAVGSEHGRSESCQRQHRSSLSTRRCHPPRSAQSRLDYAAPLSQADHAPHEETTELSASKRDRERAAQRRREQRRQAALDEKTARRRRTWAFIGVGAVLAVVAVGTWALVANDAGETNTTDSAGPSSVATPTSAPDPALAEERDWTGTLTTSAGNIDITLDGAQAPQAVANFVALADSGYYDDTPCHRLTTAGIFVLQCGDPTGTGTGGPGYSFGPVENAPTDGKYPAGTIAMARAASPDSNGSQFFIVYEDTELPTSGGGYTVFGTVTSGLDAVQAVADEGTADGAPDGSPATPVTIEGVEVK